MLISYIKADPRGCMSVQPPPGGGRLSDDVYRKIRAVDQGTSTLTQSGLQGLSARILDKSDFRSQNNPSEVYVVQLVEIIKKPGQSLGLYLREGNGIDKGNGVFASRFGDNSELEKYGDVIRPGDEILSINNVEVSTMSIDDVVLILSIPRRLLLRIRYNKNRRDQQAWTSNRPSISDRPVVVFHKLEERNDSQSANSSLLAQPMNTANTWLGKKARQQQQQEMSSTRMAPTVVSSATPRTIGSYQPRMLNGNAGQPMNPRIDNAYDSFDTIARTARVPPPKIYSSSTVRRTESFNSAPGVLSHGAYSTMQRPSTAVSPGEDERIKQQQNLLSRSLCSPVLSRPLRTIDNKSNSLPRRRAISGPRNVKWRTDVIGSDVYGEDDGATSAPEYSPSPVFGHGRQPHQYQRSLSSCGRTVNEIFSAAEYRNWATPTDPRIRGNRWSHTYGENRGPRSSSLPGRNLITQSLVGSPVISRNAVALQQQLYQDRPSHTFDRYHVSPLMNRRAPLRTAGPGINVDRLNVSSLSGILFVQIIEGKGLRIPEKEKERTEEMYCVLEVNDQHRARTGVTREIQREDRYRWRETFHIDVYEATILQFYIYSWHPQYRHKLWFRGSLRLLDKFIADHLTGDRMFSLNLEPRGQIHVRVGYHDLPSIFRRTVSPRIDSVFGVSLNRLLQREGRETPIVLTRLIHELDRRGLDYVGLYVLCGAVEKKQMLREDLERNPLGTDLSPDSMPDTNVLACLVKDFLRELPEPIISSQIEGMLCDASVVAPPNDVQGSRQLIFRVIDCLSTQNRKCLMLVLDHLVQVLSKSPHNGMTVLKLSIVFGPLLICTSESQTANLPTQYGMNSPSTGLLPSLDTNRAAKAIQLLLEHWPSRVNGFESDSESPTYALTGSVPNRISESQC
ncbi:unnamed protein product [Auanema sp. JU1783]|nr:unnamed protein product [Auanema sp. JU1783]